MSVKIVGKQLMDFKSKDTGEKINGIKLHYEEANDKVQGVSAGNVFVTDSKDCYMDALALQLGTTIDFIYNRYGKVDGFHMVASPEKK